MGKDCPFRKEFGECRQFLSQCRKARALKYQKEQKERKQKQKEQKERKQKQKEQKESKTRGKTDDHSDTASTVSTAVTESSLPNPRFSDIKWAANPSMVLCDAERKELLKVEKVLRQIDAIQKNVDAGKSIDSLQLQKLQRRRELESSTVMLKINGGWKRGP